MQETGPVQTHRMLVLRYNHQAVESTDLESSHNLNFHQQARDFRVCCFPGTAFAQLHEAVPPHRISMCFSLSEANLDLQSICRVPVQARLLLGTLPQLTRQEVIGSVHKSMAKGGSGGTTTETCTAHACRSSPPKRISEASVTCGVRPAKQVASKGDERSARFTTLPLMSNCFGFLSSASLNVEQQFPLA